jgi:hypothetical protein
LRAKIIAPLKNGCRQHTPDIVIRITGLPLPGTHEVVHQNTSEVDSVASVAFSFEGGTHEVKVEVLVPAVQHTDFLLG